MGCARWWWNYALNLCNETYKQTGKGLSQLLSIKFCQSSKSLKKLHG
ncbi:helix-turn-helix domain-containing protein [Dapis sp. BLCC M229]